MKTIIVLKKLLLTYFLLFVCFQGIQLSYFKYQTDFDVNLDEVLEKTGEYCEKVKSLALHYICKEHVHSTIHYYRTRVSFFSYWASSSKLELEGSMRKSWVYDYQLIRKSGEMVEKRNLIEEDGKAQDKKNTALLNLKFSSKYIVFGPVGFLSKYWQKHFIYEISRFEIVSGRRVVVIKASPKQKRKANYNMGYIWIDLEDFSILRIQWEPLSVQNYEEEKRRYPTEKFVKTVIWEVDFGVEEKGIRFPSLQTVQEIIVGENEKRHVLEKTEFAYSEYKFFTVETEIKY
jgi:hypothetical protein